MPIYEFECEKCKIVHELMQKFSDPPLEKCPSCQGPVHKLMSRSSFALKGSGWYSTDYKKAPAPSAPAPAAAAPTAPAAPAAATPAAATPTSPKTPSST